MLETFLVHVDMIASLVADLSAEHSCRESHVSIVNCFHDGLHMFSNNTPKNDA